MHDTSITIVGIIHRDEGSSEKLLSFLEREKPYVLTLELSNYGLSFREKKGRLYTQKLEDNLKKILKDIDKMAYKNSTHIDSIKAFLALPYEYRVASAYVKKHGGSLYLIDMDIFSLIRLKEIDRLISEDNLKKLLTINNNSQDITYELTLARIYFEDNIKTFEYTEEMRLRDEHMCKMIRLLMSCYENKKFVHICGWQHLSDPFKIYEKLKPKKVFIHDKSICI